MIEANNETLRTLSSERNKCVTEISVACERESNRFSSLSPSYARERSHDEAGERVSWEREKKGN